MSIFSQPAKAAGINLFARMDSDRQHLVLGMRVSAATDTALIVPLPVRPGCGDHEVKLRDMDGRRAFFAALEQGFLRNDAADQRADEEHDAAPRTVRYAYAEPIQTVYLSSASKFASLDEAFRLPRQLLAANPQYSTCAFLVHVLPAGQNMRVVPVAVEFPTRDPSTLFFPTVVSMGGPVPDVVLQDCTMYTQGAHQLGLDESREPASAFMSTPSGIVSPGHLVQRRIVYGSAANEDRTIPLS